MGDGRDDIGSLEFQTNPCWVEVSTFVASGRSAGVFQTNPCWVEVMVLADRETVTLVVSDEPLLG